MQARGRRRSRIERARPTTSRTASRPTGCLRNRKSSAKALRQGAVALMMWTCNLDSIAIKRGLAFETNRYAGRPVCYSPSWFARCIREAL